LSPENKTRERRSSRASRKGSKGKNNDTIPMEDREGGSDSSISDSEQEEVVAEPTSIGTLKKEKEVRAGGRDDDSSSESEVEERRERRDPPVEERPPLGAAPRSGSSTSLDGVASTPRERSVSEANPVVSKSEFSLDDSWWIDYDELELVRLPPPPLRQSLSPIPCALFDRLLRSWWLGATQVCQIFGSLVERAFGALVDVI
jgi:hypothetical protein